MVDAFALAIDSSAFAFALAFDSNTFDWNQMHLGGIKCETFGRVVKGVGHLVLDHV